MANMAEDDNPIFVLPEAYTFIPIRALRNAVRKKMAQYLDLEGALVVCEGIDVENNYNGLAELAGFSYLEIRNISRQRCPTMELLEQWTVKEGAANATIGAIWKFLYLMERFDILEDCRANILNDCRIYEEQMEFEREAMHFNIEQDPEV